MKVTLLLLTALMLLSACSSQNVETNYYLLRPDDRPESRPLAPSKNFAMGNVLVSAYLDQQGLVLETNAGEIRPARHHLWAEPMHDGIAFFLREEISRVSGEDLFPSRLVKGATVIDVRIDQLHGTQDGKAKLVAYWWLERDQEVLASYQFSESRPMAQSGYAALAATQRGLLQTLAKKIASTMVPQ